MADNGSTGFLTSGTSLLPTNHVSDNDMTRFLLTIVFMASLAGCGSNVHDMKISEFYKLSPEERREFADELSADEMKALFAGSETFKNDSAGFRDRTVGEIIEEGKRRQQQIGQ